MGKRVNIADVTVRKCARGFTATKGNYHTDSCVEIYAFDKIEDLAAWLVEEYSEED